MSRPHLSLVILAVDDLPRARAFYQAALDWDVAVDVPVFVELVDPMGNRLGLYATGSFERNILSTSTGAPTGQVTRTELYLHVEEVEATISRFVAAGARPLSPLAPREWGDEAAYLADPEGNVVVLARPRQATSE